ncbi:MAG: hypothetical protein MUE69_33965 [Myxococcota bacterium]|jgi:ribosomal protein L37AE/L43A|nr:hypothetical protein [Myxococcota bacterium]
MVRFTVDYFGGWHDFACRECGWEGRGSELTPRIGATLFVFECPRCRSAVAGGSHPTHEDAKDAAERGNAEAQQWLRRRSRS